MKIYWILCFLWSSINYSQTYFNNMLADSVNNSTKLKSDRFRSMWNGKIKGQRYLDTLFKKGEINNEDFYKI